MGTICAPLLELFPPQAGQCNNFPKYTSSSAGCRGLAIKMGHKRAEAGPMRYLLNTDVWVTSKFCSAMERVLPLRRFRKHMIGLELSCHGLVWLVGCFILLYLAWSRDMIETTVNLIIGLCIDIVAVAVIKAVARRRRPPGNQDDMFMVVQMDKYSFPSGHASRVTYLALFGTALFPMGIVADIILWGWATLLCASRVMLRRHHVLDVLCGIALGYFEYLFSWMFWMDADTAQIFVGWLTGYRAEDTGSLEMG